MDRLPGDHPSGHRRRLTSVIRWLLVMPLPGSDQRVINVLAILVGLVIALLVGLPILVVTTVLAYWVSAIAPALGLPDFVRGVAILVFGIGGGLVICFGVLLWISRRLPASIRALLYEPDVADRPREHDDVDSAGSDTMPRG